MEYKKEKLPSARIQWDSGANRQLSVRLDNSDFQKNTSCIF